jgi:hypothetical protein
MCGLRERPVRVIYGSSQRELFAIATYASCGKVNRPPSSIAAVEKVIVFNATDEIMAWRSTSVLAIGSSVF